MADQRSIRITSGTVLFYRMLDIAEQIDLEAAERELGPRRSTTRIDLGVREQAFVLRAAPLRVPLGEQQVLLPKGAVAMRLTLKVWDYGVLSFEFAQHVRPGTPLAELQALAAAAARGFELEAIARRQAEELAALLAPALTAAHDFSDVERYTVYLLEQLDGTARASELLERAELPALVLGEPAAGGSPQLLRQVSERALQYGDADLAVVGTSSALVVDPSGDHGVADVLEFVRSQLMELRYYDALLDGHLSTLYAETKRRGHGLLRSRLAPLSDAAASRYIEFSELVERLENSVKVVGDLYLATVFRTAAAQLRLGDWKDSVARKLGLLGRVSELLQAKLDTHRSHLMELVIILLILFEIVQALLKV